MPRPIPLCAALLLAAAPAWGGEFAPGGSAGALARNFALPVLGQPDIQARGRGETRLTLDLTNEYVGEGDCNVECILLDGETTRLRLAHRRGFGDGWDASLELAFMSHGGGALDGWIQDWHGWFGLPNGGREHRADGEYLYYYRRNGQVLLDEDATGSGLADVTLTLGRRLTASSAARVMAKLPTGDESAPGGGNSGGAVWFEQGFGAASGWRGYAAFGASFNQRADMLTDLQKREVAFGGIGLMTPPWHRLRLTAQLYAHSPLYEGGELELAPLTRAGMPLTLGLQLRTGVRSSVEIGFQEDPAVNASPDFDIYLSFRSL